MKAGGSGDTDRMKGFRSGQHWALRAGDADRDQIVEQLREHCAAGRLTLEEFEARLEETWRARTYGELSMVTRELPRLERLPAWSGLGVGRHLLANGAILGGWLLLLDNHTRALFPVPLPLLTVLASLAVLAVRDRLAARRSRALGRRRGSWQVVARDRWRAGALPPAARADELRRAIEWTNEWTNGWSNARAPARRQWAHHGPARQHHGPWL